MKNIVLIGMPASGKSTVGVILAKMLGYNFVDTDILMSVREGRPLFQIIAEDGYDRFIEIEGEVGASLCCESTVIATGGSMVFSESAMKALAKNAIVVWLDVPVSELENRILGSMEERGVATPCKMSFEQILEIRQPLYRRYADIRFSCEGTMEEAVRNLLGIITKEYQI